MTDEETPKTKAWAHLDEILVPENQGVPQDYQIGTMGSTGASTGPHLHFQIEDEQGNTIDPRDEILNDPVVDAAAANVGQGGGTNDIEKKAK